VTEFSRPKADAGAGNETAGMAGSSNAAVVVVATDEGVEEAEEEEEDEEEDGAWVEGMQVNRYFLNY
jgi:hypothetical protein